MKYSFAFLSLLFAGVAFGGAGVERTPTGVRLVRDGAVAWNFEIATPEGRPFFHPLTLKKGETLELAYRLAVHGDRRVTGGLAARPEERMDDGLIAGVTAEGTHVSWRWLDKKAYDLWRRVNGTVEKLTREPIVQTSDLFLPGYTNLTAEYSLDGKTFTPVRCTTENDMTFVRIPLADTNATVQATAVGDLNGDGAYDYVVKTPQGNIDPWELVWHKSDSTYKLEAHDSSGALLWIRDLGWNIEQGIWYSPFLVADLFGDWREEFVGAQKGELRVYTTDIPAMDRRPPLMRDPSYRERITMWPSGYDQQPILQYVPSAVAPNLSVRLSEDKRELMLDVTAPLDAPLKGTLVLTALPDGWKTDFAPTAIDLAPGGVWSRRARLRFAAKPKGKFAVTATLTRESLSPLVVRQPFCL